MLTNIVLLVKALVKTNCKIYNIYIKTNWVICMLLKITILFEYNKEPIIRSSS